jgi:hypothetical protein
MAMERDELRRTALDALWLLLILGAVSILWIWAVSPDATAVPADEGPVNFEKTEQTIPQRASLPIEFSTAAGAVDPS